MDLNRHVPKDAYPAGDMPEYPARTLYKHVIVKGIQAGAVFALVAAPLWSFSRGRPLKVVYPRSQIVCSGLGVAASLAYTYKKMADGELTEEGVDDRAYRIAKNAGQVKVDEYSLVGAGVGATTGALFGSAALRSVISGSISGVAAGVVIYLGEKFINEQLTKLDTVPAPETATTQLK